MRFSLLPLGSASMTSAGVAFSLFRRGSGVDSDPTASSTGTPTTTTTTTRAPTTQRVVPAPRPSVVEMKPMFVLGMTQFRGAVMVGEGFRAACPATKNYCIDVRHSDAATCMYPSPLVIKICLDESCKASAANIDILKNHGEDSYCKDYAATPEGRVCHWTTSTYCTCNKFSIEYVTAHLVHETEKVPAGWTIAKPCDYRDDYKAINYRELEKTSHKLRPVPDKPRVGGKNKNVADVFGIGRALVVIALLALVSM